MLAIEHEGHDVAKWLNSIGVAGFRPHIPPGAHRGLEVHGRGSCFGGCQACCATCPQPCERMGR